MMFVFPHDFPSPSVIEFFIFVFSAYQWAFLSAEMLFVHVLCAVLFAYTWMLILFAHVEIDAFSPHTYSATMQKCQKWDLWLFWFIHNWYKFSSRALMYRWHWQCLKQCSEIRPVNSVCQKTQGTSHISLEI